MAESEKKMQRFIYKHYSFNKYLPNNYYVPGSIWVNGAIGVNKTEQTHLCPLKNFKLERREKKTNGNECQEEKWGTEKTGQGWRERDGYSK